MEELKEFCDAGLPITLSPEWEEFDIAKKLLEAYDYQEDPESEDPNTFIKVDPLYSDSTAVSDFAKRIAEEKIIFPDIIPQAEYKRPSGERNRHPKVLDPNWSRTKLSPEWEEFDIAKKLLEAYDYQEAESEDLNTFIAVSDFAKRIAEEKIIFPDIVRQAQYKLPSGERNRHPKVLDPNWSGTKLVQFDTTTLPVDQQVILLAAIPTKQQIVRRQKVRIQVAIQPHVKTDDANLLIHLQTKLLSVGVIPKTEAFVKDFSLGYYPSFIRLSLQPRFADPSTVALPLYTPKDSLHPDSAQSSSAAAAGDLDSYRRTTGTRLGGQLGWGPISFSAEQSWETEREISREFQRLVPVNHDEGNAASFEWRVLRWSDGVKYNASKPHSGFFLKTLKPPFAGGTTTHVRLEGFPGVVWHLDPQLGGSVVFDLHLEVEMHLVWFLGTKPFFKSPGSDSASFEFRSQFEVL